jgi:ferrous iron transport protein B
MGSCGGCGVPFGVTAAATPEARTPRPRTVAIVGPPNSGKSTLFNRLTGLRQKVANFPGVTVEQRVGRARFPGAREICLVDLPGIYSLDPRSEDERVTRDVLTGRMEGIARPDAVLLILDSTNLARHLTLAAPVLALGIPTLVILNMADDLAARGGVVDAGALAHQLGAPVTLISAMKGEGLEAVSEFLSGSIVVPSPLDLPATHEARHCRQWARTGGAARQLPASRAAGLDAPAGRGILAPRRRAAGSGWSGGPGLPGDVRGGAAADGRHPLADLGIRRLD